MCRRTNRTIKRSNWRWTCCAERPPMPPSRLPGRRVITDEPTLAMQRGGAAVEKQLGPEYVALFNALDEADPSSDEVHEILSLTSWAEFDARKREWHLLGSRAASDWRSDPAVT